MRYADGLAGLPVTIPQVRLECSHVFHHYVLASDDRDGLKSHLESAEIETSIHYPLPVHHQDGYAKRVRIADKLSVTDWLAARVLSLPMYPELQEEEIDHIIATIRAYYSTRNFS
jgi:dTDP-4-amino-4,6-dideoxygalactose transaminase